MSEEVVTETVEEVAEMAEVAEAKTKKLYEKGSEVVAKIGGAYKFAFFTCIGAAITAEEKLVSMGKSAKASVEEKIKSAEAKVKETEEKVVGFSKEMAEKGSAATSKMDSPKVILTKKLDAPKAKLVSTKETFKTKAQDKFTDVEEALDKGMNKSLSFIGVPSRKDMDEMTTLMKTMADSISDLSTQLQKQKTSTSSRSTAKKSTASKSSSQTSAA